MFQCNILDLRHATIDLADSVAARRLRRDAETRQNAFEFPHGQASDDPAVHVRERNLHSERAACQGGWGPPTKLGFRRTATHGKTQEAENLD